MMKARYAPACLGHFGLATGNSNPKTRLIKLALSFEK